MTTPTFKPGDRVRVARDTIYGAKKGAEFTITYISTPTTPEGAYASGEGFPGGVWLTDLELVETAPVPLADWEKDLLDESARPIELSEYDKELLEEIRQAATEKPLGVHLGAPDGFHRDRLIAHINDQDAVIRRRNATIERQKAQLAEYAAQLESVYTSGAFPFKPLRDLQKRIGKANAAKGFHRLNHFEDGPDDAAIADYTVARLALIATEVAEAIEEVRTGHAADKTYYSGENSGTRPRKPEGVPSELADVVIRAFDFAHEFGIDLAAMIEEKLAYNKTRPHRHAKQF